MALSSHPDRIASGEAANRPSTLTSYFEHEGSSLAVGVTYGQGEAGYSAPAGPTPYLDFDGTHG